MSFESATFVHNSKDRAKVDRIIECETCKPKIVLDVDMDKCCHNYVTTHNESMKMFGNEIPIRYNDYEFERMTNGWYFGFSGSSDSNTDKKVKIEW